MKQTRVTVYQDMDMNSGYEHSHHTPRPETAE